MSEKKKVVLSRHSINQPSSSSPTQTYISKNFPTLPIHPNRFGPIAPRARPPYSVLASSIPNTIPSPSPKIKPIDTPQRNLPTNTPEYSINPNKQIVKILEPIEERKLDQSFLTLIDYLYPKNSHFYIDDYKVREYYQAILIDSGSVIIDHTLNDKNPEYIDCSKVKILKVITPEEWSLKPYNHKTLASYPQYPVYNYCDYQDAWFHAFLLRNFNHTWFFHFSKEFSNNYPKWFIKWFRYFGSIPTIFPTKILEGFHKFKDYFLEDHICPEEYTLQFSAIFQLPWITLFTYKKQDARETSPPLLYRQFSVKWWKRIEDSQADIKAVTNYYQQTISKKESNPSMTPIVQDKDFIRRLQACSSPEEMQQIINEIKSSPTPSEDLLQDAQDPYEDITL